MSADRPFTVMPTWATHVLPITFDLLFRYLTHIGYKVRYVRNITDVGHFRRMTQTTVKTKLQRKPVWNNWRPWKWHSII